MKHISATIHYALFLFLLIHSGEAAGPSVTVAAHGQRHRSAPRKKGFFHKINLRRLIPCLNAYNMSPETDNDKIQYEAIKSVVDELDGKVVGGEFREKLPQKPEAKPGDNPQERPPLEEGDKRKLIQTLFEYWRRRRSHHMLLLRDIQRLCLRREIFLIVFQSKKLRQTFEQLLKIIPDGITASKLNEYIRDLSELIVELIENWRTELSDFLIVNKAVQWLFPRLVQLLKSLDSKTSQEERGMSNFERDVKLKLHLLMVTSRMYYDRLLRDAVDSQIPTISTILGRYLKPQMGATMSEVDRLELFRKIRFIADKMSAEVCQKRIHKRIIRPTFDGESDLVHDKNRTYIQMMIMLTDLLQLILNPNIFMLYENRRMSEEVLGAATAMTATFVKFQYRLRILDFKPSKLNYREKFTEVIQNALRVREIKDDEIVIETRSEYENKQTTKNSFYWCGHH